VLLLLLLWVWFLQTRLILLWLLLCRTCSSW
jgi:hypothetical protein